MKTLIAAFLILGFAVTLTAPAAHAMLKAPTVNDIPVGTVVLDENKVVEKPLHNPDIGAAAAISIPFVMFSTGI